MRPSPEVHDALACLLSYPGEGVGAHYAAAVRLVRGACPGSAPALDGFLAGIGGLDEGELEELYTRTFDNVAERSLEVGWQLFGENYARGVLLVRIRALLREHGVPERTELPDHMKHVLPLLGRAPADLARALAKSHVQPAAEKMLAGLKSIDSPWVGVLEAVSAVLGMHATEPLVREAATEAAEETTR